MDSKRKAKALRWCKDGKHTLDDIYNEFGDDFCGGIETQDYIREYIINMINKGIYVAHVLQAIEDNTACDYFEFDCENISTPNPIYDTSELAECIKRNY